MHKAEQKVPSTQRSKLFYPNFYAVERIIACDRPTDLSHFYACNENVIFSFLSSISV